MGTLAFERGASTLGQQLSFESELVTITELARGNGLATDPVFRQRLADAWITLRVMRFHALRTLPMLEHGTVDPATSIHKLLWASFHRGLGELAVDVLGADAVGLESRRRRSAEWAPGASLPLLARRHDLRRLESDPTQRDRRTGPGSAEGAPMTNLPIPPTLPAGAQPARGQDRADHRRRGNGHRLRHRQARGRRGRAGRGERHPRTATAGVGRTPRPERARRARERHRRSRRAAPGRHRGRARRRSTRRAREQRGPGRDRHASPR